MISAIVYNLCNHLNLENNEVDEFIDNLTPEVQRLYDHCKSTGKASACHAYKTYAMIMYFGEETGYDVIDKTENQNIEQMFDRKTDTALKVKVENCTLLVIPLWMMKND